MEERHDEIVIYQSEDGLIKVDVLFENETVWLTMDQMCLLFEKAKSTISEHIQNIYAEGELKENETMRKFGISEYSTKPTSFYNLDVIISVGYRVKSQRGTQFRIWANQVLKDYLLKGYAINSRLTQLEQKIDMKLLEHEQRISSNEKQIGFFIRMALPPIEGIFCDGQIFDAYVFVSDLIRSAKSSVILIDNYIDVKVLQLLSKRERNVLARIYTRSITDTFQQDINSFNQQYEPIEVQTLTRVHDRFLIVDDVVYHIGASLKDLGKKMFAFSRMGLQGNELLEKLR